VDVPFPLSAVHVRSVWAWATDTPSDARLTASAATAPSVAKSNTRFRIFSRR
jgi:hypothetical protein